MITVRPAAERGVANFGWLDSRHSFSFGHYYDPEHMGFGRLRVINEDRVQGGRGFDTHPHRDMEIISYVLQGELEHRDTMGNSSVIRAGDVQRMTAGTGVMHSELNHSATEPVHFLQIWILPETTGLTPSYEERHFSSAERTGKLRLVASRDARADSLRVHQDADVYASLLRAGERVHHVLEPGRIAWLQVAGGAVALNELQLLAGDGAAVSQATNLSIAANEDAELLLFDLPE